MKVAIRADASTAIGSGHVTRCLTLADALRGCGAKTLFICRAHEGNLIAHVRKQGHRCAVLASANDDCSAFESDEEALPPNSPWLETHWRQDAKETMNVLERVQAWDWLIVDHYALDWRWEQSMRARAKKIMVIDGETRSRHDCDIFLHQSPLANDENYRNLAPASCRFLTGINFVLLRPEFSDLRPVALARRKNMTDIRRLLVTFGGADPNNLTDAVLRQLSIAELPRDCTIDVILGASFPYRTEIETMAASVSAPVNILLSVDNMAKHMARADLAIGSGGMTAWERCCLGLPSITIMAAENQRGNVAALEREKVGISLHAKHLARDFPSALQKALHNQQWYEQSAYRSARLVDGQGADKVAEAIISE